MHWLKTRGTSQHPISCDYRPAGETPFEWRFAGGPIVARAYWEVGGHWANPASIQSRTTIGPQVKTSA